MVVSKRTWKGRYRMSEIREYAGVERNVPKCNYLA
jgi:hypothetical protein